MRLVSIQIALLASVLFVLPVINVEAAIDESAKLLPDRIESFHASGAATDQIVDGIFKHPVADQSITLADVAREYRNDAGARFWVELVRTQDASAAYALLTQLAGPDGVRIGAVGAANIESRNGITFCTGANLVRVEWIHAAAAPDKLRSISRTFAAALPRADDDVPVLIKHLPNWPANATHATYVVTLNGLKKIVSAQPILDSLSFDGGTEAVIANYDKSQLVIVEFTTPQFAGDNDRRIVAKIQELKNQGQPAPAAYRRVGNYSVFVFNAPDEKSANQLIDQVKYEQVVQWLGDNPHWYERAENYLIRTTGGVVIAVVEGSIVAFLICLGIGAVVGTMLFRRRRAQAAATYTDAGGAVRLNLDELTANRDPRRLLESGKER
jgi:hypothetical protein